MSDKQKTTPAAPAPVKFSDVSNATRKASKTREERIAKRRQRFAVLDSKTGGIDPVEVEAIGGTAALVQSASQGGIHVEHLTEDGHAMSVPVEAVEALGFTYTG